MAPDQSMSLGHATGNADAQIIRDRHDQAQIRTHGRSEIVRTWAARSASRSINPIAPCPYDRNSSTVDVRAGASGTTTS